MRFANPAVLYALWFLPLLLGLVLWAEREKRRRAAQLLAPSMWSRLLPGWLPVRQRWREVLRIGAAACLIVALARPQFGQRLQVVTREGLDIMVAIDTSNSMLALDAGPGVSRLDAARRLVSGLCETLEGDRLGLVVFAGSAYVQCPLTLDYKAARMLLGAVGPGTVPQPGTALGEAIDRSVAAFSDEGPWRALVLVTDGEDHEGDPVAAAERAAKAGVPIFTIGLGADRGELVPVHNDQGDPVGYHRDAAGELVVSKLDEATLRAVAETSGGAYMRARGGGEIDALRSQLERLEKRELEGGYHSHYEDRFHLFALAAFCLLALSRALAAPPALRPVAAGLKVALGLVLMAAATSVGHAESMEGELARGNRALAEGDAGQAVIHYLEAVGLEPQRPEAHYNLGSALYTDGAFDEAEAAFGLAAIRADSSWAPDALYNLGNAYFRQEKYKEAASVYKTALKRLPGDPDLQWNLEVALRRLAESESQSPEADPQDDPDQNQDNQQSQGGGGDSAENSDPQSEDKNQPGDESDASGAPDQPPDEGAPEDQDSAPGGGDTGGQPQSPEAQPGDDSAAGMSAEEARRWLRALTGDEESLLKKRFKAPGEPSASGKDW